MSKRRIAILPGDGIGREIMDAVLRDLGGAGFEAEYVPLDAGQYALDKGLPAMPPQTIETIREIGVALKSPTTTPVGKGHKSANVVLRQELDLFANVRPAKSLPGVHGP